MTSLSTLSLERLTMKPFEMQVFTIDKNGDDLDFDVIVEAISPTVFDCYYSDNGVKYGKPVSLGALGNDQVRRELLNRTIKF